MEENNSFESELTFRQRYTEFVVDHHKSLRRIGLAGLIGSIPLGVIAGIELNIAPPVTEMAFLGTSVIINSLGIAGRDIEAGQQG